MAELVDALDSGSSRRYSLCGFESRLRHFYSTPIHGTLAINESDFKVYFRKIRSEGQNNTYDYTCGYREIEAEILPFMEAIAR